MTTLTTVPCRDRASRDCDVVVSHASTAVWLRVGPEERLLDETQAQKLYLALGVHIAAVQTARHKAGPREHA
ncbi:hypothetical protein [Saccharopolyspora sp. ASAGF58]|uniref:hypothetical protein n=1 Tax=Saccharopolyspora sp. ASAGF58 TaxID=2719023 RepID=UPI00143FE808|nr:hypothetical protein [Saccharopolyspora sp. ASAGF58]QIZ34216.1 hypothetical protein FDZ84_05035 [Saccharopolyspora sp. ASAGF58]